LRAPATCSTSEASPACPLVPLALTTDAVEEVHPDLECCRRSSELRASSMRVSRSRACEHLRSQIKKKGSKSNRIKSNLRPGNGDGGEITYIESQVKFSSETTVFFLLKTVFQFRLARSNQEPRVYIVITCDQRRQGPLSEGIPSRSVCGGCSLGRSSRGRTHTSFRPTPSGVRTTTGTIPRRRLSMSACGIWGELCVLELMIHGA